MAGRIRANRGVLARERRLFNLAIPSGPRPPALEDLRGLVGRPFYLFTSTFLLLPSNFFFRNVVAAMFGILVGVAYNSRSRRSLNPEEAHAQIRSPRRDRSG